MRFTRPTLLAFLVLSASAFTSAQQPPPRDPQALVVLGQMAAATGWNGLSVPRDAVATGGVTRYRGTDQDTVSVTLKAKSCRVHRTDVQDSTGTRSTIVNGEGAVVVAASGTTFIPPHSAVSMQGIALPFFCDLAAFGDTTVSLHYSGTENVAGQPAHRVEISRQSLTEGSPTGAKHRANRLIVWISAASALPVQIASTTIAIDNPSAVTTTVRVLSDYRAVGGVAVPFRQQVQQANGQVLYTLQLTSINFNVGLSDVEFALPAAQP